MDILDQCSIRSPSRCELDDVLQSLALRDGDTYWADSDTDQYAWPTHKTAPSSPSNTASLYSALAEEDMDSCDVFVYDPSLFSPSSSAPASPSRGSFLHMSDRDKPLPTLPPYHSTPSPPSTPRSSHSRMSTPSSSPRASVAPPGCEKPLLRSRPPSANMSNNRATYTHATFPSISSTLSLLEERETEMEKRSGVIVTELDQAMPLPTTDQSRNSSESTILAQRQRHSSASSNNSSSSRRSNTSREHIVGADNGAPRRPPRPTLNLSTSTSSPQLRELAELANTPASPILATTFTVSPTSVSPTSVSTNFTASTSVASPRTVRHHVSLASLTPSTPSTSSPLASSAFLLPPVEVEPPSRWSMDSVTRPVEVHPPHGHGKETQEHSKPRRRDRLMSLISRGRASSIGKPSPSPLPLPHPSPSTSHPATSPERSRDSTPSTTPSLESRFSSLSLVRRSYVHPLATSPSTSTASTASSLNLLTPADSRCDLPLAASPSPSTSPATVAAHDPAAALAEADPFCPASPTFAPASYLPEPSTSSLDMMDGEEEIEADEDEDVDAGRPTLPLPAPGVPTASFFHPSSSREGGGSGSGLGSTGNFLAAALAKTRLRRRKKKLVVCCLSANGGEVGPGMGVVGVSAEGREGKAAVEAQRREREAKKRCESVVRWCESFGPVRRVERKPDGSLHVYWKDWEVADMVCRVSGQVYIKGVGRVSLAWRYVN